MKLQKGQYEERVAERKGGWEGGREGEGERVILICLAEYEKFYDKAINFSSCVYFHLINPGEVGTVSNVLVL